MLSNLGVLYTDEGRYSEAEEVYKRALEIREKVLEPETTHQASMLSNFGRSTLSKPNILKPDATARWKKGSALHTCLLHDRPTPGC